MKFVPSLYKCVELCALLSLPCLMFAGVAAAPQSARPAGTRAVKGTDFLSSIGVNSSIAMRGETLQNTIDCAKYLGIHWFRAGIEGDVPIADFIKLHRETGAMFSWGIGSGGRNVPKLISTAKQIAAAGALMSFEGPNEPNNFSRVKSTWMPIAELQRDLYQAVKSDPVLRGYPVFSISENGAELDNVGLQFLTIPQGAGTLMPAGTQYADYANVHNYIYHGNSPKIEDNKTWNASDPTSACKVDGLYGNYGKTWAKHFTGYSGAALINLPRVTTETGCTVGGQGGQITEKIHALNLLSLYLDQFKRGWTYTAVYLLRDRVDESGNQKYGFYTPDYKPRLAAEYLHNLTTILTDKSSHANPGTMSYSIPDEPATAHDMLLQKGNGTFDLIVWGEQVSGASQITVHLGKAYSSVRVYDPTVGTNVVQTHDNASALRLSLSDHPMVIAIR